MERGKAEKEFSLTTEIVVGAVVANLANYSGNYKSLQMPLFCLISRDLTVEARDSSSDLSFCSVDALLSGTAQKCGLNGGHE